MHIGNKIKALVVENSNVSFIDFANKIGISEQGLHKIFKKADVSTKIIKQICATLNIKVSEFFKEEQKVSALSKLHEEAEACGEVNYKEKYYEALEKLNAANEKLLAFTDLKKEAIKKKK